MEIVQVRAGEGPAARRRWWRAASVRSALKPNPVTAIRIIAVRPASSHCLCATAVYTAVMATSHMAVPEQLLCH